MKTVKFNILPRVGYSCDTPGDQSGEYVRAEKVSELLDSAKTALTLIECLVNEGRRVEKTAGVLRNAIAKIF